MKSIFRKLISRRVPAVSGRYGDWATDQTIPTLISPVSQLCTQNQFDEAVYEYWVDKIHEKKRYHKEQWEFAFILQNLNIRCLLEAGRSGLGFGVGQEPLPALMASRGVQVTATDLDLSGAAQKGWLQPINRHRRWRC